MTNAMMVKSSCGRVALVAGQTWRRGLGFVGMYTRAVTERVIVAIEPDGRIISDDWRPRSGWTRMASDPESFQRWIYRQGAVPDGLEAGVS